MLFRIPVAFFCKHFFRQTFCPQTALTWLAAEFSALAVSSQDVSSAFQSFQLLSQDLIL